MSFILCLYPSPETSKVPSFWSEVRGRERWLSLAVRLGSTHIPEPRTDSPTVYQKLEEMGFGRHIAVSVINNSTVAPTI